MSNCLEFRKEIQQSDLVNGVAALDGSTNFANPLQLPMQGLAKMQVCSIQISDRIPNVFNAMPHYAFDNTIVRMWTNAPAPGPLDIHLPRGLYSSVDQIADAINSAVVASGRGWYTLADPALKIEANPITDVVIITLDTTKLMPPHFQLTLDLRKSSTGTDMATTLGFSQPAALIQALAGSVQAVSDQQVQLDTQGTTCDIWCSLITQRRRNKSMVRTLALIPFAGKSSVSDSVWPAAGQISPVLVYEGSKTIMYMDIEVKTMAGLPMLFMGGAIHVVINFHY